MVQVRPYLDLLERILEDGRDRGDRTGTGTRSIFGAQMRFDLRDGFPLVTTKKLNTAAIVHELLWLLSGSTDVTDLHARGAVRIWDEWATAEQCAKFGRKAGDLGPTYGHQWRNFGATSKYVRDDMGQGPSLPGRDAAIAGYNADGVDQIAKVVEQIRSNPNSRRLIVTGWNPAEADQVALPPCHTLFQFYVEEGELSLQLYQRSGDMFLGVPFNIASYALLLSMVAQVTGLRVGDFVHTLGDAHIYLNHLKQVDEQRDRAPRDLPTLVLNKQIKSLFDFTFDDIRFDGYDPHPAIKAEVSV